MCKMKSKILQLFFQQFANNSDNKFKKTFICSRLVRTNEFLKKCFTLAHVVSLKRYRNMHFHGWTNNEQIIADHKIYEW
jgi:hypothetical protein